ncbi:hypothetical protein ACLMJK_004500 [Lecanora helva]
MTSISQPVIPPQSSGTASQAIAPSHSPSASVSGKAAPQAAGTASAAATASYAGATKKPSVHTSASGNSIQSAAASSSQHGKPDLTSPTNGKITIPPAVPVNPSTSAVNGNTPTSSTSGRGEHSRKPSVTISAAGASGHLANGGPVAGKPKGGSNIQFGAVQEGSPRPADATLQATPSISSLAVNSLSNPRITSPQRSPSPIPPQPAASGGRRPPSSLHGNSNSVSFGNFNGLDGNMRPTGGPQPPSLAAGPQSTHLRRESSQSQHSDMSSHGMATAPGRGGGYPSQSTRGGRNSFQGSYPQQGGYPYGNNSRPPPNQPRNAPNMTPYQGQSRGLTPFSANSPHQAVRSPALAAAQPVHPSHPSQTGQVPMGSPPVNPGSYGYPHPYGNYPQGMGQPQVNPKSSSSSKPPVAVTAFSDRFLSGNPDAQQTIDLSPASGNFDHYLTSRNQAFYPMPPYADPGMPQYYQQYSSMPPNIMPPGSPRPPSQMNPGPQQPPYHAGQYNNQPQPSPVTRSSSAMSHGDRPSSSMGKPQTGAASSAINNSAPAAGRPPANSPAPKPPHSFQIPQKKKTGAVSIKNPETGEALTFEKTAPSPAPSSKSQTPAVTSTPTPPPRAPSHTETQHSRTESKSVKTDEEKRAEMREAIARKMQADKQAEQRKKDEEDAKMAREKQEAEDKLIQEKIDADNKQREAAEAQMKAEEAMNKSKAEAAEAEKAAAKAKEDADAAAEKARQEQDLEDEIARMEAEYKEKERLEEEREAQYQAKKKADKEEAARKEAEKLRMADEDMKKAEAEAEAKEEARLKALEEAEGDDSQKERELMFASLKKDGSATPSSQTTAAEETPVDSGVATPASDAPIVPASSKNAGKQKPAALKLETTKPVEPAQPTPQLLALRSARPLLSINDVSYPPAISSPNPALNTTAPTGKFRYERNFLLQFESAFKEKPSENWDARLKETVGDTTEPSSARATPSNRSAGPASMMGGRQPSNRTPMAVMGSFGQGGRTLPPGTSSQQRFEASTRGQSAGQVRPPMVNPVASFIRPGAMPQSGAPGIKMDRTPSSTSMNHPNSPRVASQRGGSQRGSRASAKREDPKDNKTMPLTAGGNVKPIEVTATGWKPRSVGANAMAGPAPGGDTHMAPDVVQRKVKSNLNKMTPNNFDKITIQILEISAQSKDENDGRTLRQVIQLTFEKATDEAHWAEMYAQFCKRMLESMSPEVKDENIRDKKGEVVHGGSLFRKYLLNRCQEEFERGWKMNIGDKPEGETEEATMLSDQYYIEAAAKRRGLGLVRFIGELYKLGMLTERIMHECVKKLVDYEGMPDEAEVESLTNLLKTIGQPLDSTEKGPKMMDAYFGKINEMIAIPALPSRLRFMLMDIVDLRKARWAGKGGVLKGPTTLDEVRAQAQQAEMEKERARQAENSRRGGGGGGGGRPPIGRGDARNFSGGGQFGLMPPPDYQRNLVGMDDLRRLGSRGGSRQVSSAGPTNFGPPSNFLGPRGSNTTRRSGLAGTQKDDSGASSRTGTPPTQKEKKEKDEKEAASRTNTFSALAGLESQDGPGSPPSTSPPVAKSQPVERRRSKSPKDHGKDGEADSKPSETS